MPGRVGPPARAQLVEVKLQSGSERAGPVPLARVDDHAGRLVDHGQQHRLRRERRAECLRPADLRGANPASTIAMRSPALQLVRRLDPAAVDFHAGGVDHLAQQHAAVGGKLLRQKPVQPDARLVLGARRVHALGWRVRRRSSAVGLRRVRLRSCQSGGYARENRAIPIPGPRPALVASAGASSAGFRRRFLARLLVGRFFVGGLRRPTASLRAERLRARLVGGHF